jgi:nickel-dependent lactate racemase
MNDRRRVLEASASPAFTPADAAAVIADALAEIRRDASRVLVLAPDDTRKIPVSQTFRAVWQALQGRAGSVDVMIAQGTHASMPEAAKRQWVFGADAYPDVTIYDHEWARADALVDIGSVTLAEQRARFGDYGDLAPGLGFDRDMPVRINRRLLDYDRVILLTRVQPHEGAGFAGGAKQIFPGVSGPEMINLLHTIGSLRGARAIQGVLDNPVRELIDDMTRQVPVPLTTIALVVDDASGTTRGVFVQPDGWREGTRAAAALSAEVNIRYTARRVSRAVAATPRLPDGSWMYPELWTGAKGVFRGDDAVADGGELVLYAPGVREISATHGRAIRQVGLHGWPYLLAHPQAWQPHGVSPLALTLGVLIKGDAPLVDGRERPRIDVRLATAIPPDECRALDVGYEDPDQVAREIDAAPADVIDDDRFVMHNAGSVLWRCRSSNGQSAS